MMNIIAEILISALKKVETLSENFNPGAVTAFQDFILSGANANENTHQTRTTRVATWTWVEILLKGVRSRIISLQCKD